MAIVVGIETSCDETAVAVVDTNQKRGQRIIAEQVLSQLDDHRPYGGVVPEVAARAHLSHLEPLVDRTISESGLQWGAIDAIAATTGPGLIGGVMVGATFAKAMALVKAKPFIAVNHLEAHALSPRLVEDLDFPYLLLLVSGGHCQILNVEGLGQYRQLGATLDDALGEAFDKTAKMLGLGYPGGPAVEAAARKGDPKRFVLPRPMTGQNNCDFSFSGLKTAVRQTVEKLPPGPLRLSDIHDLSAAFQTAATDCLVDRLGRAIALLSQDHHKPRSLVVAGGVAANGAIRSALTGMAEDHAMRFIAPPLALCTDNGAMIAWCGAERYQRGQTDPLSVKPIPRWPLTDLTPP